MSRAGSHCRRAARGLHFDEGMASELFHRIVTPTDFSDCAQAAWALTQQVASAMASEVVLVHVFVEPHLYGESLLNVDHTARTIEEGRKWVAGELERWATAARDKGLAVRTQILTGSPYQKVVDLAAEERADLVIMGTHGRGGVSRALLGSVADRVIRFAPCPVLIVRTPA
jgi:nucleotide-binding universal stress UspA family protein